MKVNVIAQRFALTPAVGAWVHEQIDSSLEKFSAEVGAIDVHLSDAHGPQGGKGTTAAITVLLNHRAPVRITTVHSNLYSAIAISARRCEQAVQRSLRQPRQGQQLRPHGSNLGLAGVAPV